MGERTWSVYLSGEIHSNADLVVVSFGELA